MRETLVERGSQFVHVAGTLWGQRAVRRGVWLGLAGVVLLGGVAWCWPARVVEGPVADEAAPWRYLLVCRRCGLQERWLANPRGALAREGAALRCPGCGAHAAAVYRRGGQVLPPAGWATSRPANETEEGTP